MKKTVFTAEVMADVISKCNSLLQENLTFSIEADNETNVMMEVTDNRTKIVFSPLICNHPEMNESAVYSYILHICSAFHTVENGALYWERLESCVKKLSKEIGIEYMNHYEIEAHVRKVRRIIFPDSANGGCYFKVGQFLHWVNGSDSGRIYLITNISPLTEDGIFITYVPNMGRDTEHPIINEEDFVFNHYIVVERKRRPEEA